MLHPDIEGLNEVVNQVKLSFRGLSVLESLNKLKIGLAIQDMSKVLLIEELLEVLRHFLILVQLLHSDIVTQQVDFVVDVLLKVLDFIPLLVDLVLPRLIVLYEIGLQVVPVLLGHIVFIDVLLQVENP